MKSRRPVAQSDVAQAITPPQPSLVGPSAPGVTMNPGFAASIQNEITPLLTAAVAGELSKRGFATIAIDFPYHGERIACIDSSLVAVPNFFPEILRPVVGFEDDLIWFKPCESGDEATCSPTGECLDEDGNVEDFASFPIMDMQPASGAAFLDTHDLPHIPDHFHQSLVDLSVVKHSLQTADWEDALGQRIQTDRFHFAGQSLGAIIGSVWVGVTPEVDRAVLNVPGSNMVDLFRDSTYFAPQIDQYFEDLEIEEGSWEQERLLNVASWLVDSVDPHTVGHLYAEQDRSAIIQIAKVNDDYGDIIIPNYTTESLQRVSQRDIIEYNTVLHADLIIPGLGINMLEDMSDYLAGEL